MIRVLLLDDDSNISTLLSAYGRRMSIPLVIDQAFTPEQATALEEESTYDVLIVDHNLGASKGLDYLGKTKIGKFIYSSFYLDSKLIDKICSLGGVCMDKNDLIVKGELFREKINALIQGVA